MPGRDLRQPKRRKAVKKRNSKRHASEWERVYGSVERVAWVNSQPCLAKASGECSGKMENAHVASGGIRRKADAEFIVPLCRHHHIDVLHWIGNRAFDARYGVDLAASAARIYQLYLREHPE